MYSLLNALPEGAEHVWSFLEKERFAKELEFDRERKKWAREREGFSRERESFLRERESLREGFLREREGFSRERNFLIDREALAVASLKMEIDHSEGLITVRAMLEAIVTRAFPNRSATEALSDYCEKKDFVEYLDLVSKATTFSSANLIKSAKGAYRLISNAVNNGSIHSMEVSSSPRLVIQDECTLLAVSAIFKFERRDVCFYVGGRSSLIKIPLPPHRSLVR
jgi:hypothetical protein